MGKLVIRIIIKDENIYWNDIGVDYGLSNPIGKVNKWLDNLMKQIQSYPFDKLWWVYRLTRMMVGRS